MSNSLLGFVFLVLGVWSYFSPRTLLEFKASISQAFGAKLSWSKKTEGFLKYVGIVLAALGLLMLLGLI